MPKTNMLKEPELIESMVYSNPEDSFWELQTERILGIKTKRNDRRIKNEFHKRTQHHRQYQTRNR